MTNPLLSPPITDSISKGILSSMITARQKVLTHLKKTRSASAREIARALKMTAPNVRHHLSVLCSDGRVEVSAVHNREGRGRPEKMYSLSAAALGDNLSALADALLTEAGSTLRIDAVAGHILDSSQFANLPTPKRLALLVEKLNEMHYDARWEAGAEGPRVILTRCPYAKVIQNHPELCKMDAAILRSALGSKVEQTTKIEKTHGLCAFAIR
jgi:predicted ArsR family transcriptional regulator